MRSRLAALMVLVFIHLPPADAAAPAVRTEQFIRLGASSSSTSGKPYLVKCGTSAPIESKAWLSNELRSLRAPAAGAR